jgi:enoyl-CoA hydratase/carnithine racemase
MPDYEHWQLEIEEHVATLTLNRPKDSNSLLPQTLHELAGITEQLGKNRDAWVVVLQAQGVQFSIGVDVEVIRQMSELEDDSFRQELSAMQLEMDAFEALEKPTIAKLHGFCLGGGLILALCCDFRIASERTIFGFPEVKRGIPVLMGTHRLTRVIGPAAAKEMIYLAELIKADVAVDLGLIHKVVPQDDLNQSVATLAGKFMKLPPRTVSAVKRIFQQGYSLPLRESQELEIEAQAELMDSSDMREALISFFEKRPPQYTGD